MGLMCLFRKCSCLFIVQWFYATRRVHILMTSILATLNSSKQMNEWQILFCSRLLHHNEHNEPETESEHRMRTTNWQSMDKRMEYYTICIIQVHTAVHIGRSRVRKKIVSSRSGNFTILRFIWCCGEACYYELSYNLLWNSREFHIGKRQHTDTLHWTVLLSSSSSSSLAAIGFLSISLSRSLWPDIFFFLSLTMTHFPLCMCGLWVAVYECERV